MGSMFLAKIAGNVILQNVPTLLLYMWPSQKQNKSAGIYMFIKFTLMPFKSYWDKNFMERDSGLVVEHLLYRQRSQAGLAHP